MTTYRELLTIPNSQLDAINAVLLNPQTRVIDQFLEVVSRYGTPEEINRKHRESRRYEALCEKIKRTATCRKERGSPSSVGGSWRCV